MRKIKELSRFFSHYQIVKQNKTKPGRVGERQH